MGGGYDIFNGIFIVFRVGFYIIFSIIVVDRYEIFWLRIVINGSEKVGMMVYNYVSVDVY